VGLVLGCFWLPLSSVPRERAGAGNSGFFLTRGELMAIVAGVDFGTLSVRVSLVDSDRGLIGSALAEYPLHRKREDADYATQSHEDHMRALAFRRTIPS